MTDGTENQNYSLLPHNKQQQQQKQVIWETWLNHRYPIIVSSGKNMAHCIWHKPFSWLCTELSVIFNLGLCTTRPQRGHNPILQSEGDHLAVFCHCEHLRKKDNGEGLTLFPVSRSGDPPNGLKLNYQTFFPSFLRWYEK